VPATVIVGAQWGDEGKGKIVDLLAGHSDFVCRYNGGPNAGHTIVADGETYKVRHIPSGILRGKECVIGAGCVVDPEVLVEELDELAARGVPVDRIHLSANAHVIMPWHVAIDQGGERRLGKLKIGTTKRGIGPTYADKAFRLGIRVQDLLDPKILRQKLEVALAEKNVWLERVYGTAPLELEQLAARYEQLAQRLRPFITDTSLLVDHALRDGKTVLLEGAHATLLDLDHGTYPFVTSSNPVAGAACVGAGVGPADIDEVWGVAKAYATRVGAGPFPSELDDDVGRRLLERGHEYGTTTGRQRRTGWIDLVALRYAVRLNRMSALVMTKLDVLGGIDPLRVAVRYRHPEGAVFEEFPYHQSILPTAEPEYDELPGFDAEIGDARSESDLPREARDYLEYISDYVGVPVRLVGVGPARDQVVWLGEAAESLRAA
jgi:adenylosuccinate synthase